MSLHSAAYFAVVSMTRSRTCATPPFAEPLCNPAAAYKGRRNGGVEPPLSFPLRVTSPSDVWRSNGGVGGVVTKTTLCEAVDGVFQPLAFARARGIRA